MSVLILNCVEKISLTVPVRLSNCLLGLTTGQKINALSRFQNLPATEKFYSVAAISVLIIMVAAFVASVLIKNKFERTSSTKISRQMFKRTALTNTEEQILKRMAQSLAIVPPQILLTDNKLFDRAAAKILMDTEPDRAEAVKLELTFLRDKLGFRTQMTQKIIENASRQDDSDKPSKINRRRFVRVDTYKPAFVADFSFKAEHQLGKRLTPPEFMPAVVIEMGGPGLKLQTDIQANIGDRVLIAFEMELGEKKSGIEFAYTTKCRLQQMAVVRNTGTKNEHKVIAVELEQLSENQLNSLVRATNAQLIRNVKEKKLELEYQNSRVSREFVGT